MMLCSEKTRKIREEKSMLCSEKTRKIREEKSMKNQ